jgi:putative tryptophan/tyrosine transport system substrate-binding protein
MRRREFIAGLAGTAAWPMVGRAQQPTTPVAGFLFSGSPEVNGDRVAALLQGMGEAGFVAGRNVTIEYRWTYGDPTRGPALAADLVTRRVAVIATSTAALALQAKTATTTIPIVFVAFADAVRVGLVTSLSRPGGNVTGINSMQAELGAKRFEFLHALRPQARRFGILVNPSAPDFEADVSFARAAANTLGLSLEVLAAGTNGEIDAAFSSAVEQRVDALVIARSQLFSDRRIQLATLSARHALPAIFFERTFPEVGGLMSYASRTTDQFRQAGIYVGRILKGERPADLPVLEPNKFELIINRQTARLLGIEVPSTLLAIADEVIE